MNIEESRALCREYAERGMRKLHTEDALERAGCDKEMIEEVIADFTDYRNAHQARRLRAVQLGGAAVFLGSSATFLYFVFFHSNNYSLVVYGLAGTAMWGVAQNVPAVNRVGRTRSFRLQRSTF